MSGWRAADRRFQVVHEGHIRQEGHEPVLGRPREKWPYPFPGPRRATDTRLGSRSRTAESPARPSTAEDLRAGTPLRRGPAPGPCPRRERTARRSQAWTRERAICASLTRSFHRRRNPMQRCRGIAAAAAEPRHHRNVLFAGSRSRRAARRSRPDASHSDFAAFQTRFRAVGRHPWHIAANFERPAPRFAFHAIEQVDGLQQRLDVMEPVRAHVPRCAARD